MLFHFQLIDHKINQVGEIPAYFLERSIQNNVFDDNLFPNWFVPVISKLPALKSKFSAVFDEVALIKLTNIQSLNDLHANLVAGTNVVSLCENEIIAPPRSRLVSVELHLRLKKLYEYFFEETLKSSRTLESAIKANFNDQYSAFRVANLGKSGKVCPMCGLHEYPLSSNEPKAQYDHWLPQDIYPLLAINFNNLVPICGTCNNIKRSEDLLFNLGVRTISFYPYQNHGGVSFTITAYTSFDNLDLEEQNLYRYGKHDIEIIPNDPGDLRKIDSWDRVFHIKKRYATYLSDYYDEIKETLKEYLLEHNYEVTNGANKVVLVQIISAFIESRIRDVRREKGAHLKRAYLNFIINDGNEYLLYTLFGIRFVAA